MTDVLPATPLTPPASEAELSQRLDDELMKLVLDGWRVEFRTQNRAALSRRSSPMLWLHVLLTIVTVGIWFVFAVLIALFDRDQRCLIWVEPDGRVLQKLS